MPDANLPIVGKVPKPVLVIGGLTGVGVALYVYMKHKAQTSAEATTGAAYGYGYGYGYGGYGYLNPALTAPLEYTGGDYGYGYYGYGGSFAGLGGYGSPVPPVGPVSVVSTNAGWVEAAEQELVGVQGDTGVSGAVIAAALGKYIAGAAVTPDQQTIIQEAIGFEGYPPQPGPNNYPPNIKTGPATGQSGGGGTTPAGGKTKVYRATGSQDLSQIAHAFRTTGGKLIALKGNTWLVRYYGNTKKIPKGDKINVPA